MRQRASFPFSSKEKGVVQVLSGRILSFVHRTAKEPWVTGVVECWLVLPRTVKRYETRQAGCDFLSKCFGYLHGFEFNFVKCRQDSHSEWVTIRSNGEFTHPDYDGDVYKDYMILKLTQEVTNPNIKTVGLAGDTTMMNEGDPLTVIGFGALYEGGYGSDTLQKVNVNYVSEAGCNSVYGNEDAYDPDYMFCAGGTPSGGTDSCQGDSGKFLKDPTLGCTLDLFDVSRVCGCMYYY